MIDRRLITNFNWVLLLLMLLLIACGFINLYSATYMPQREPSEDKFLMTMSPLFSRQMMWFFIGLAAFVSMTLFDYRKLQILAPFLYFLGILLLGLVLVVGEESHGAVRWLKLGPLQFQPSELEKIILIISVASWGSMDTVKLYPPMTKVGIFLLINLPPFFLVFLEPDLGTSLILLINSFTILFCLGIRKSWIIGAVVLGLLTVYPLWNYGLKDYQKDRIRTVLDPDKDPKKRGYHVRQARIAIGSGMAHGKGYLKGTQSKLRFLPERHTDFAFAVLAEEWGFVGSVFVTILFALIIYLCFNSAFAAKDRFGSLLVIGLSANIAWEVVINLGMVVGLLPVVGVPLPFISYGGSALLRVMIILGLIQNVNMRKHTYAR